jgi:xylan 1,4-beta-xylosidase
MKKASRLLIAVLTICGRASAQQPPIPASLPAPGDIPVSIQIDATKTKGKVTSIWRFFGYDEANYTTMKDGRKLLSELGQMGGPQVYIRCHHLLTSGDGVPALKWSSTNAYTEDAQGHPVYDWTITDGIFDTYLKRGLKPYVEIGFMPEALSIHPQDYPHHPAPNQLVNPGGGFSYPPKDYAKWRELAYQWTKHCVEKYGQAEVESWYWEVWNEPNINYWRGTHEDYFKLYDYAVEGVRRALPTARVGGPEVAGGAGGNFLREFLDHCAHGTNYATGRTGSPLDFISFHAKGSPKFVSGHVEMGMEAQLSNIKDAFTVIASFPEYKRTPIVIGESDPEGCAACKGPDKGYRNGTMYSSYTAAVFACEHEMAATYGVNLEGALTWAFEFENQPYFAGYRVLASNGLDLPVLNVFRMFAKMSGQRLDVESSAGIDAETIRRQGVRAAPDVSAFASLDKNKLCVMVWHYHDDDVPGPAARINLTIDNLRSQGPVKVTQYRIDRDHSNSFAAWNKMGSPQQPTSNQYAQLEKAGQLESMDTPQTLALRDGKATFPVTLPRQAVSLFVFEWR